MNLQEFTNEKAGNLSGGTKRRLSVANALIGDPPIILLDEPSACMDPEAKRFVWKLIEKISQRGKKSAVIMTTHTMDEAELLSSKLGIMVEGGFLSCINNFEHTQPVWWENA